MKLETSGTLRRIDIDVVVELAHALQGEWASLSFDGQGRVLHPFTGEAVSEVILVSGRHRQPGSVYRITAMEGKTDREFDITVVRDSADRLEVTGVYKDFGTLEAAIVWARFPRLQMSGLVDIPTVMKTHGVWTWFSKLMLGQAKWSASIDPQALAKNGKLVTASGSIRRLRAEAEASVKTSLTTWSAEGLVKLRAKGLGRFVLAWVRRQLPDQWDAATAKFWAEADSGVIAREKEFALLRAEVEREGGAAAWLHRVLWDPDFDSEFNELDRDTD